MENSKPCPKCGEPRVYVKDTQASSGLRLRCVPCYKAYRADYYLANKEHCNTKNKAWHKANPERVRENANRWYHANLEKAAKTASKYQKTHREECTARMAAWRKDNHEHDKANQRKRYAADPAKHLTYSDLRRAARHGVEAEKVDRNVVYDRDKGFCHICGVAVFHENWHLDHIVPISKGGKHIYSNVAVSHPGCNIRKRAS